MELIQFKCPNCSGSVVFAEDKDKAFCNYCGAELHFQQEIDNIQKEHKSEIDALSDRITDLIEDSKFLQAEKAIQDGLLQCPYAGRLHLYMLMCELNLNDPELLGHTGKDYTMYDSYKKCLRYMTTEDKQDLLKLVEANKASIVQGGFSGYAYDRKPTNNNKIELDVIKKWVNELLANDELSPMDKLKRIVVHPTKKFNYLDVLLKYLVNNKYYLGLAEEQPYIEEVEDTVISFCIGYEPQLDNIHNVLNEIPENINAYSAEEKLLIKKARIFALVWDNVCDMQSGYQQRETYDSSKEGEEEYLADTRKNYALHYEVVSKVGIQLKEAGLLTQLTGMDDLTYYLYEQYAFIKKYIEECLEMDEKVEVPSPSKWIKAGYSEEILEQELQEIEKGISTDVKEKKVEQKERNLKQPEKEDGDKNIKGNLPEKAIQWNIVKIGIIALAVGLLMFIISLAVSFSNGLDSLYAGKTMIIITGIVEIITGIVLKILTNKTIDKKCSLVVLGQQKTKLNAIEKAQISLAVSSVKKVKRISTLNMILLIALGSTSLLVGIILTALYLGV